ncbi:TPA: putative zinc ribbon protein [Klebsiella oxytoca]
MHKSTLHNLKLYLALDSDGHYVISKEMKNASDAQWFCPSCSCPVKLRNNIPGEDAWFVHNPDEATKPLLYLASIILAGRRQLKWPVAYGVRMPPQFLPLPSSCDNFLPLVQTDNRDG